MTSIARSPNNSTNEYSKPGDLWPGESAKLDQELMALVKELRALAFVLVRAIDKRHIRRVAAHEKAQELAHTAHRMAWLSREIERAFGESFNGLVEAAANRKLGSSILGSDPLEDEE